MRNKPKSKTPQPRPELPVTWTQAFVVVFCLEYIGWEIDPNPRTAHFFIPVVFRDASESLATADVVSRARRDMRSGWDAEKYGQFKDWENVITPVVSIVLEGWVIDAQPGAVTEVRIKSPIDPSHN